MNFPSSITEQYEILSVQSSGLFEERDDQAPKQA